MKALPPAVSLLLILGLGAAAVVQTVNVSQLKRQLLVQQEQSTAQRAQAEAASAELSHVREQNAVFKTESETLRERLATIAPGAVPPRKTVASADDKSTVNTASDSDPSGGNESASKGNAGGEGFMRAMGKMFTDPEMRKAMRAQQGMGMRMVYGDLGKQLGLSSDEFDAAMEILTDRQMEMTGKSMEMLGGKAGDPAALEASGKAVNEARKAYDDRLRELLGPERYGKLESYEKTIGERVMLQQYGAQFSAAGAPLGDDQREALLEIMGDERAKTPAAFDWSGKDPSAQLKAIQSDEALHAFLAAEEEKNRRVLERARAFLSPEQLTAFEKIQKQMAEMQLAGIKMTQTMFQQQGK